MKNNLTDLTNEMVKMIKDLDGFKSPLTESMLVDELAIKLENTLIDGERHQTKEALRNMFMLGQIFTNNQISKRDSKRRAER